MSPTRRPSAGGRPNWWRFIGSLPLCTATTPGVSLWPLSMTRGHRLVAGHGWRVPEVFKILRRTAPSQARQGDPGLRGESVVGDRRARSPGDVGPDGDDLPAGQVDQSGGIT